MSKRRPERRVFIRGDRSVGFESMMTGGARMVTYKGTKVSSVTLMDESHLRQIANEATLLADHIAREGPKEAP